MSFQRVLDTFNADPRILCLILSTRSGGMVVNLTGVDTVIFYDSDWVPTLDDMASDCCNRINLTRDLHVYRSVIVLPSASWDLSEYYRSRDFWW